VLNRRDTLKALGGLLAVPLTWVARPSGASVVPALPSGLPPVLAEIERRKRFAPRPEGVPGLPAIDTQDQPYYVDFVQFPAMVSVPVANLIWHVEVSGLTVAKDRGLYDRVRALLGCVNDRPYDGVFAGQYFFKGMNVRLNPDDSLKVVYEIAERWPGQTLATFNTLMTKDGPRVIDLYPPFDFATLPGRVVAAR
jgi:hypothetical protein